MEKFFDPKFLEQWLNGDPEIVGNIAHYPATITTSRFTGRPNYYAFPCQFNKIPKAIVAGYVEECKFWDKYQEESDMPIGEGDTIMQAFNDLVKKMRRRLKIAKKL